MGDKLNLGFSKSCARSLLWTVACVCFLLSGCGVPGGLFPPTPNFDYTPPPPLPASTLGVEVSADISAVPHMLSLKAPKLIQSGQSDDIIFTVHRNQDLNVDIASNLDLTASASLAYRAAIRAPISPRCGYNVRALANRPSLNISVSSKLSLRRDYSVKLESPSVAVSTGRPCLIGLTVGDIDLSPLVQHIGEHEAIKNIYPEFSRIEQDLQSQYSETIEDAWNTISAPIPIAEDARLYLNPVKVLLTSPTFRHSDSTLNSRLGLTFRPEVVVGAVGDTRAPASRPLPLADIGGNVPADRFDFYVPALIGLDTIENGITGDLLTPA